MTAEPPKIDNAPGLKWKARAKGRWEAWWRPRRDLMGRGYPKTMHRLWVGLGQDLLDYIEELRKIPELPFKDTGRRLSTEFQPEL